ncbi:MAG: DNA-processing protein DprA [Holosporales bacterium]|jgi:DNA processing protein|nr:DNA-processing protein DprA [Holosporales bacterium]
MIDEVVVDWFCLISSKSIGPKTFWAMMRNYKTAKESLRHVAEPFPRDRAIKILKSMNCGVVLANEPTFPKLLKRSCSCPPMLFYRGDKALLTKRKIAIIGARNSSITGQSIAKRLAENLAGEFAIVSGLAKGIDTAVHTGILESSSEKSAIAVLPFGFDNVYPRENSKLCEELSKGALVLTEIPNGRPVDQGAFQARNRIIALLSEAIIVVEAAVKSGTMATAKMALDVGCEVLVVPGSPVDPRYFGSNLLIKNGATLIQSHIDVLDALGQHQENEQLEIKYAPKQLVCSQDENSVSSKVLSMLSETPISIDEIAAHTNMSVRALLCVLSELEIAGHVVKYATNEVALSGK